MGKASIEQLLLRPTEAKMREIERIRKEKRREREQKRSSISTLSCKPVSVFSLYLVELATKQGKYVQIRAKKTSERQAITLTHSSVLVSSLTRDMFSASEQPCVRFKSVSAAFVSCLCI